MNTSTPTKRSRRHAAARRRDGVENHLTAANVAAIVDLTGDSSDDDDDDDEEKSDDNEDHLDCKPKAKKKEYLKTATTSADDALIDLTSPTTKQPTTTSSTTLYDSDDDDDSDDYDDDDVVLVVDPSSAAAATTTTRRHSHHSSPRRRRRSSGVNAEESPSLTLARRLQEQDSIALQHDQQEQKTRDEKEAVRLQKEFDAQHKKHKQLKRREEEEQMSASVTGRAWKFVEKVLALDASIKRKHHPAAAAAAAAVTSSSKVSAIAKDDMVFLCEQMIRHQEAFRSAGKPVKVDLGFHYTRPDNLARIRTNGLLSKAEREGRNITSAYHGSSYGDGIYTSDDHSLGGCTGCYGDIGIIVARLKGVEKHATHFSGDHDCNQSRSHAITVLKTSGQCLALVEFHRSVLFPTTTMPTTTAATTAAAAAAQAAALSAAVSAATTAGLTATAATISAALQALNAAAAPAAHIPTPMTIPAVNSGIIGEYHRELQKIVDETFNKKS